MAVISSKVIFVTTSPRTPEKMISEIALLDKHFSGKKWDKHTQCAFMELLKQENFFNGTGLNDPAFSARDRINRAPKALGFVVLSPVIGLTQAGLALVHSRRKEEVFLRQLLKFQIPSPYHKPTEKSAPFCVKPYLEFFRLIRHFGSLRFDELMIFGLQLVDYRQFDAIVAKIDAFRAAKAQNKDGYKKFRSRCLEKKLYTIYADEIASGNTKTRETQDISTEKFLRTKAGNLRDYADACFRYLRATGMVNISYTGKSISMVPERITEVDFILKNYDREPVCVEDAVAYADVLGNAHTPVLATDDRNLLEQKIQSKFPAIVIDKNTSLENLKESFLDAIEQRKQRLLAQQVTAIKDYRLFGEITDTFSRIAHNRLYDAPLMLEWNTWRAMTMLDGGNIKANLKFDDFGMPLSTAQGNMADIVCDYGDFCLAVEVTLQNGQRQYEAEGESVARHVAKLKGEAQKPTYGLFIAPKIHDACIAHFYGLHKIRINHYGGTSTIVPMPLAVFLKMLEDSYKANHPPKSHHVRRFFERSNELAANALDEREWYSSMTHEALHWLKG